MYIVTGAAGLIGSGLVWGLNRRGITNILAVDHLGTSEKWKNLRGLKFADYIEKDDFRTKLAAGDFEPNNIEGILHMGACSATTEKDATYLVHNNFEATKELAEFAEQGNIRMVYASSCATYGDGSQGYLDDESRLEKLRPLNMYGYSKQMFDLWAKRNGLLQQIAGCKFSNVFGPNELHKGEMRSVILRAYEQISGEGRMRLFKSYREEYPDGEQKRDFLYVKDAVDMVLFLFDSGAGGVFNIGSGRAETWNSMVCSAFKVLERPENIEYIEMPESLRPKYQYFTCAEMSKLANLGWQKPARSLESAIADYYKNYLIPGKHLGDE
ncbi:MAG: ADP-glyceromanno-heptose 6-epimerase [Victivallaceae bacterium]